MSFLRLLNVQGIVGIAVAVILGALLVIEKFNHADTRRELSDTQALYTALKTVHDETIINYYRAAEQARQADAANTARVKAEQSAITKRITTDYEARLSDARARAERLRRQANSAANPGGSGTAGVSRPGPASGGADGSPPDRGLSLTERLIATEQALQLDALQRWVRGQSRVDVQGQ